MFSLQSYIGNRVAEFQAHRINVENFHRLYVMDERQLADIGLNRSDLGFTGKPPRLKANVEAKALKAKRRSQKQAIKELRAMSDADLHDLGITRGSIVEAVRFGRKGLEEQPMSANAARKTSRAQQKRAARELNAMSDAQLEDIGIIRADINDLVRNGKKQPVSKATRNLAEVNNGLVVVASTAKAAANMAGTNNAPKPPRNPVNRPAAA